MGLADYQPETRVISLKGGSFSVRGLSLEAFTTLVRQHLPDLEAMWNLGSEVLSGRTELTQDDLTMLAITFAEQAPGFTANVIALASGDTSEKAIEGARSLPFPVQVQTLVSISELTFDEVGGIKKALESVAATLAKTKGSLPTKATDSTL